MAKAELNEVWDVDIEKLWNVIIRYEDYPKFVTGCTKTEVNRTADSVKVQYHVSVMSKDILYSVDIKEDAAQKKLTWKLTESGFFSKNEGGWELKKEGEKTRVRYSLDMEFKMYVPGFILKTLVSGSLPTMVRSFINQAKKNC